MRFLSICSGIEAASVAFRPLGWEAVAFSEIEPFPCALLAHHYPHIPNLGDMRQFRSWDPALLTQADLLCGGTPCQAFSVAGLRGSLDDERGNLTLTFCHLYDHIDTLRRAAGLPPAICLWENVPGVLSTADNAFGSFLAGLSGESVPLQPPGGKWAYAGAVSGPTRTVAWRTLDAQYFGLAQRRSRVLVVASADPAFRPEQVLFEFEGLRRDTPPRRQTGKDLAPTLSARTHGGGGLGTDAELDGALSDEGSVELSPPLTTRPYADNPSRENGLVTEIQVFGGNNTSGELEIAASINANRGCHNPGDFEAGNLLVQQVTHTLRAKGFDASEDGTGRGTPIVPIPFTLHGQNSNAMQKPGAWQAAFESEISRSIDTMGGFTPQQGGNLAVSPEGTIPFDTTQITSATDRCQPQPDAPCHPLTAHGHPPAIAFPEYLSSTQCASTPDLAPCVALQETTANNRRPPQTIANAAQLPLWRIRRLVCEECEILQGFPPGYTIIPLRKTTRLRKGPDFTETVEFLRALFPDLSPERAAQLAQSPDGPRYKAIGNSWPVPVITWLGRRIQAHLNFIKQP